MCSGLTIMSQKLQAAHKAWSKIRDGLWLIDQGVCLSEYLSSLHISRHGRKRPSGIACSDEEGVAQGGLVRFCLG